MSSATQFPLLESNGDGALKLLLLSGPGMGHINPICQLALRYAHADPKVEVILVVPYNSPQTGGHPVKLPEHPRIVIRHLIPDGEPDTLSFMKLIGTESALYADVICNNCNNGLVGYTKPFRLTAGDEANDTTDKPLRFNAILYDMFVLPAIEIAERMKVPALQFCPSPLPFYYFSKTAASMSHPLDRLDLPGIGILPETDLPDLKGVDSLAELFHKSFSAKSRYLIAVIFNDVEAYYSPDLLRRTHETMSPIKDLIFVGPLLGADPRQKNKSMISSPEIEFLDRQEPGSTLLVAFGSWGAICDYDRLQLARALEQCNRPVIWAYRKKILTAETPSHRSENLGLLCDEVLGDDGLPVDFKVRNANRIFCAPWIVQEDILKHPSLGAFMTHAGWNSISEALYLSRGIPLLCTPIGAEQAMNSSWLVSCGAAERTWRNPLVDQMNTADIVRKIDHIFTDPSIKADAERLHTLTHFADSHSSLGSARYSMQLIRHFENSEFQN